jgi:hypothetical protein
MILFEILDGITSLGHNTPGRIKPIPPFVKINGPAAAPLLSASDTCFDSESNPSGDCRRLPVAGVGDQAKAGRRNGRRNRRLPQESFPESSVSPLPSPPRTRQRTAESASALAVRTLQRAPGEADRWDPGNAGVCPPSSELLPCISIRRGMRRSAET